jgi:nitrogen regulatory protein P-II 1
MSPGVKSELADFTAKVRIEIIARDDEVDGLVRLIHDICHTGQIGDGVLWVTPVDDFRRLRQPLAPGDRQ